MYTNCNLAPSTLETGWDLRGLFTDAKPTDDQVPNGSSFVEMDTGSVYLYDKENKTWRAI